MADGGSIKQAVSEVVEAVVPPVTSELKQIATDIVESISGSSSQSQDPSAIQKKQLDDQKKIAQLQFYLKQQTALQEAQAKIRQENLQKQLSQGQAQKETREERRLSVLQKQRQVINRDLLMKKTSKERRGGLGG